MHLLPFLAWFSWEDLKKREIDDGAVYALFWTGILLNFMNTHLIPSLLVTLAILLPLHLAGIFALGDLWMGLVVAAHHPFPLAGVAVVVGGVLVGALYSFLLILLRRPRAWLRAVVEFVGVAAPFGVHPLLGLLLLPITRKYFLVGLLLLPFSSLPSVFAMTSVLLIIKALFEAPAVFTHLKEPEVGDIPAEVVDKGGKRFPLNLATYIGILRGEIRPVHSLGADGLTEADVERLKRLGIEKIRVKEPLPLIPFIAVAYIIIMGVVTLGMWPFSWGP